MREIARVQQGFFPTQDRIIRAVAKLFNLPTSSNGPVIVLDAGCGTGRAIHNLSEIWLAERPGLNVTLLGIESDKNLHSQAADLLGPCNVLWSDIDDAAVDQPGSLHWFNPPCDRIRGAGRTETVLFNRVKDWPARGTGLMLMIVSDHVQADVEVGLAIAAERDYELLGLLQGSSSYPDAGGVSEREPVKHQETYGGFKSVGKQSGRNKSKDR